MYTTYDAEATIDYAKEWALARNSRFSIRGEYGEGTNFVSQCLYSGAGVMNTAREVGWYYNAPSDVTPSWTDPELLYRFLITNKRNGPYAAEVNCDAVCVGDVVQFADCDESFYHSAVITKIYGRKIFVCAHNNNAYMRPLTSYTGAHMRFLHIVGVRTGMKCV